MYKVYIKLKELLKKNNYFSELTGLKEEDLMNKIKLLKEKINVLLDTVSNELKILKKILKSRDIKFDETIDENLTVLLLKKNNLIFSLLFIKDKVLDYNICKDD